MVTPAVIRDWRHAVAAGELRPTRHSPSASSNVSPAASDEPGPRAVMRSPSTVTLASASSSGVPVRAHRLHLVLDPVGELPAVGHQIVVVDAFLPLVRKAGDVAALDEERGEHERCHVRRFKSAERFGLADQGEEPFEDELLLVLIDGVQQ